MIRHLRSEWQGAVIVCGKCSKKVGGGFGDKGRTPLAKALRATLKAGKGRKAAFGIVESKCLGICPKRAVVAVVPGGDWLVVPAGADVSTVIGELGLASPQA